MFCQLFLVFIGSYLPGLTTPQACRIAAEFLFEKYVGTEDLVVSVDLNINKKFDLKYLDLFFLDPTALLEGYTNPIKEIEIDHHFMGTTPFRLGMGPATVFVLNLKAYNQTGNIQYFVFEHGWDEVKAMSAPWLLFHSTTSFVKVDNEGNCEEILTEISMQ